MTIALATYVGPLYWVGESQLAVRDRGCQAFRLRGDRRSESPSRLSKVAQLSEGIWQSWARQNIGHVIGHGDRPAVTIRLVHLNPYLGSTAKRHANQPISKAGNRLLRPPWVRAADHARRQDPQLAHLYWIQMVQRGKTASGAVCVVAAYLAERA
jgi:hypothetical protein